ncbi:MAG: hypothetical protein JOZ62_08675 [Acidobacteriaceae bacterium]|nr:hypothetical protein [Acidobacteriaceae bacterium]
MKLDNTRRAAHPGAKCLALQAGGDLPWLTRLRVRLHISRCRACAEQVSEFRAAILKIKQDAASEPIAGFETTASWSRLEREMIGNIAVGVAAARCIDKVGRKQRVVSAGALVTIAAAAVFVAGWMTHIPKEQNQHLAASLRRLLGVQSSRQVGTIVQATPEGIAVKTHGATLRFMHPPSAAIFVAGSSAVTARYVDENTGQVTITNVYGQ